MTEDETTAQIEHGQRAAEAYSKIEAFLRERLDGEAFATASDLLDELTQLLSAEDVGDFQRNRPLASDAAPRDVEERYPGIRRIAGHGAVPKRSAPAYNGADRADFERRFGRLPGAA